MRTRLVLVASGHRFFCPAARPLALCALLAACSDAVPAPEPALHSFATIHPQPESGDVPLLGLPVYLRTADGQSFWTLDTTRKGAVAFNGAGIRRGAAGSEGRGPGEIRIALGMDLAEDGSVWIADPGNGKVVGFRDGRLVGEFLVDHQPLGIAAARDGSVWVAGDLVRSVLRRYDRRGKRIGTAGVPVGSGDAALRLNQGVAARGTGPCEVVWAYTFRSILECYSADGQTLWRAEGPTPIHPARDADPYQMSPGERLAYLDVAAGAGEIHALFIGGPPTEEGVRTREVHVFDASTGTFIHRVELSHPAKYIVRHDSILAAMDYDPEPLIRLYRVGAR